MAGETGNGDSWLRMYMADHSTRLGRIEDKVNALTGKVYANAAIISLGVSLATAFIVAMIMKG